MAARPSSRALAASLAAGLIALLAAHAGDAPAGSSAGPQNNGTPTVTGTAEVGQTLTGHNGSWFCDPPYRDPDTGAIWGGCKYDFRWQRCGSAGCTDIAGADQQDYSVAAADAGSALRVAVTATNYDCNAINEDCRYSSATAVSAQTAVVPGGAPAPPPPPPNETPPTANALPVVAGLPQEGQTLTASTGDWSGAEPMGYTYQWSRCATSCAEVTGATAVSYRAGAADVGSTLRVSVRATNPLGSATAMSEPSLAVAAVPRIVPVSMSPPAVYGAAREGQLLTAATGSWSASPPPTYTFGWLRCDRHEGVCLPIPDAFGPTYVLGPEDGGRALRVVVTATNVAGAASATSPATPIVEPRGLLHLLDGRESVPAASVLFPDGLRLDRVRFRAVGRRTVLGSFHVSDTRGYVVRGALVSVRPLRRGAISDGARRATSTEGSVSLTFAVDRSKLGKGRTLVLFVHATKPGDMPGQSVAARVRVTLRFPAR